MNSVLGREERGTVISHLLNWALSSSVLLLKQKCKMRQSCLGFQVRNAAFSICFKERTLFQHLDTCVHMKPLQSGNRIIWHSKRHCRTKKNLCLIIPRLEVYVLQKYMWLAATNNQPYIAAGIFIPVTMLVRIRPICFIVTTVSIV